MDKLGAMGFQSEVHEIPIEKIRVNPLNPRKRYSELSEDELLASLDSKGVINPVIVYEENGLYVLLEGQRRFEGAKKLKFETIPARVLEREPTELENLSMMFHIHNVAEDWTEMAVTYTIKKIVDLIGTRDVRQISKITSLSEYKIKKYLRILRFPERVLEKFLESEVKEHPDLDVDFLLEIYTPIQRIERVMPDVLKRFPKEKIVEICIEKKRDGVIQKNKEFRDLGRVILNAKRGKLDINVAREKIVEFLENEETSIGEIYSDTSEAIDQAKDIMKVSLKLSEDIRNIDLRKVPLDDREELRKRLKRLMESIRLKID